MIKHLLVPLDGSRLAESALPAVSFLAEKLKASVTLVHVIEKNAPAEVHGEPHLRTSADATAYLERIQSEALPADVTVDTHVHTTEVKNVAESIVQHVGEFASDLIVMCTHGQGGVRDWLFGSIAQQVIGLGATPVLLVRPMDGDAAPPFGCRRILVPLDGHPDHEHGLTFAARLARSCDAAIHLLMVVPTLSTISGRMTASSRLLPGTTSEMLEISVEAGQEYLQDRARKLEEAGLTVTTEVLRGEPAPVITDSAVKEHASLIALGTHGKSGLDAFWSGSVAPDVCRRCVVPLLLVPVHEQA